MDEFTIRPATNADSFVVADIVFSVLREYGLTSDADSTDADLGDLEGSYRYRGGAFDVLQDSKGVVVGCVGLYSVTPYTCELRKMYLRQDVRGQGLGRRLLDHALHRAQTLGFRRVVLETASVLEDAIALYASYGFQPYQAGHLSHRCDQSYSLELHKNRPQPHGVREPRAGGTRHR